MRGDGPKFFNIYVIYIQFSLHRWGWTEYRGSHQQVGDVFPTQVGMDR